MIAVVQRVTRAEVFVDEPPHSQSIETGLCVLLCIERNDSEDDAKWMAKKLSNLRIFCDTKGNMNLSILDIKGELLLISQFTLAADCLHGNRPSFIDAATPDVAKPLMIEVENLLAQQQIPVKTGVFGAMMRVVIENDGPVTIVLKQD
jgi:D-tyrosyl-tRNA(Tyr) deacylase